MSLSLNYGFCVGPWCSVDWVSGVCGLLLLPHGIEESVHVPPPEKKKLCKA